MGNSVVFTIVVLKICISINIYKDIVYKVAGNFSDLEGMDSSELYLQTGIEGLIRCKNNIVEATD